MPGRRRAAVALPSQPVEMQCEEALLTARALLLDAAQRVHLLVDRLHECDETLLARKLCEVQAVFGRVQFYHRHAERIRERNG